MLSTWTSLRFCCFEKRQRITMYNGLALSQKSPGFYVSAVQLLKTLCNFSFSQSVFYPFQELSVILI